MTAPPTSVDSTSVITANTPASNAPPKRTHKKNQTFRTLIAGGVAGAVSRTCTSPLERLKVLYQVQDINKNESVKYRGGVWNSLRGMLRNEGWMGLFKGNGTNVLRIAPYSAVQFLAFETYKTLLQSAQLNQTLTSSLAGGFAGVTAVICTYPLDLVRTRLTVQIDADKYRGVANTFSTVIKEEGFMALYKGMFTSILGIGPYSAINFAVYDALKRFMVGSDRHIRPTESLTFGGIAGAAAQTCTYPIDLLRRRMQLQGMGGARVEYTGPLDAVVKIVRKEGVLALYKGMIPCYLKVVPSIAISFMTYEIMRKLLGISEMKVNFGAG